MTQHLGCSIGTGIGIPLTQTYIEHGVEPLCSRAGSACHVGVGASCIAGGVDCSSQCLPRGGVVLAIHIVKAVASLSRHSDHVLTNFWSLGAFGNVLGRGTYPHEWSAHAECAALLRGSICMALEVRRPVEKGRVPSNILDLQGLGADHHQPALSGNTAKECHAEARLQALHRSRHKLASLIWQVLSQSMPMTSRLAHQ